MILVYNDTKGHCIAWNGYCCYDPDEDKTYSGDMLNRKNPNYDGCQIIVFKTPLYKRALNFIKKPFYELMR